MIALVSFLLLASCTVSSSAEEGSDDALANLANQIIIQEGGYVHPSLQLVSPAPCGADRGVIFAKVTNHYGRTTINNPIDDDQSSNIWLRVPISYQLTRNLALETLTPLIPTHVLEEAPLVTLDDAALLVLLLVHLRGLTSIGDKWYPFLTTLPDNPGCGWWGDGNASIRNVDISESQHYAHRVSHGMAQDYGHYLAKKHWPDVWHDEYDERDAAALAIKWALCIVSSRGTAASPNYGGGSVRLVPLADLFNHHLNSGGFIELTEKDDAVGSREELMGAFEVRKKEGTMAGEEITVDYNLDGFSPEDWFLSHGFVPSEVVETRNIGRSEL